MLAAVTQKPLIVKYASKRLRQDLDVAKATITNGKGNRYFSEIKSYLEPSILNDPEIQEILNSEK